MKNAMDNNERINILRFVRGKNTGLSSFFRIMNKYGSITKFVDNFDSYNNVKGIELASIDEVLEEIEKTEKINAKIIPERKLNVAPASKTSIRFHGG